MEAITSTVVVVGVGNQELLVGDAPAFRWGLLWWRAIPWNGSRGAVAETPDRLLVPDVDEEYKVDVAALADIGALDDLFPDGVQLWICGLAVRRHAADIEAGGNVD